MLNKKKMFLSKVNLESQLDRVRSKKTHSESWEQQLNLIFDQSHKRDKHILQLLKEDSKNKNIPIFSIEQLDSNKIYHLNEIKRICIDYRLRFLDNKYFKGTIPQEALLNIKELENKQGIKLSKFKIVAPSKLFKLENADDPLLFTPIGNDYFYLIHKWGGDLHPLRKYYMWFFKSFENLLLLTFLISLISTLLIPQGLFSKTNSNTTFFLTFLFMFKSIAAIVIFYGFALGKNFNSSIWNSKYYNS